MDVQNESPGRDDGPGVPGKWVLLAIILVSIVGSAATLLFIRPIPGSEPADANNRPFGPATRGEQNSAPLIYRSGDGD